MIVRTFTAALLVSFASLAPGAEPATTYPVAVRVVSDTQIEVRNSTTEAGSEGIAMPLQTVALRAIQRRGGRRENLLRSVRGSVSERPKAVDVKLTGPDQTRILFETGLLLPGERRVLTIPAKPRSSREIVVAYAVVPGDGTTGVWLTPRVSPKGPGAFQMTFVPASAELMEADGREPGLALLDATKDPGSHPLSERQLIVDLDAERAQEPATPAAKP